MMEEILRITIERIISLSNSRKLSQLKSNCKSLLELLPELIEKAEAYENQSIVIAAGILI